MIPESSDYLIHKAFGLRWRSQLDWLPIPKDQDQTAPGDVEIIPGTVPKELANA